MSKKQLTEKQLAQETDFGDVKWHNLSVEECLQLQNAEATGLTEADAQRRLDKYGTNELTPPPKPSFLMKLFLQVNNILIYSEFPPRTCCLHEDVS
jgi:magnesium-transporting ATPase (P-type)